MSARRRLAVAVCLAIATAGLCGCANHPYKAAMPSTAAGCDVALDGMAARPLYVQAVDHPPAWQEFAVVAGCYRTAAGQAVPAALYDLTSLPAHAQVRISSALSAGGTFAAQADMLDDARHVVGHFGFDRFVRRGAEYSLDLFPDAVGARPHYLLLSADPSQAGRNDTTTQSISAPIAVPVGTGMMMVANGTEAISVRPLVEGGQIRIVALLEASAPMSD